MLEYIGYVIFPLISIDIFYILYTLGCKLMLKRYKLTEKNLLSQGFEVEEMTVESLRNKKVIIGYVISTFIGIVVTFTANFEGSFLKVLKSEFLVIFVIFLMFYSFFILIRRLIYLFKYTKGFVDTFKDSDGDSAENSEDNQ